MGVSTGVSTSTSSAEIAGVSSTITSSPTVGSGVEVSSGAGVSPGAEVVESEMSASSAKAVMFVAGEIRIKTKPKMLAALTTFK